MSEGTKTAPLPGESPITRRFDGVGRFDPSDKTDQKRWLRREKSFRILADCSMKRTHNNTGADPGRGIDGACKSVEADQHWPAKGALENGKEAPAENWNGLKLEWGRKGLDCLRRQRVGHPIQEGFRIVPAQTGVGDRHAVSQRFIRVPALSATLQVTFKHDAHD